VIFTYNITRKITKIEKINNSAKNLKATFYRKGETGGLVTDIIKAQVVILSVEERKTPFDLKKKPLKQLILNTLFLLNYQVQ